MQKNLGTIDRIARVILAAVLTYLYFSGIVSGALGIILLVVSVGFVATSLFSFCPIYMALKLSTLKK